MQAGRKGLLHSSICQDSDELHFLQLMIFFKFFASCSKCKCIFITLNFCHCFSVAQSCPTLCDPMDCRHQAFLSITNSWSLPKLMSIESVMPSNHLIFCRPLLLPPSIFPIIGVFSSESILHIRWPKYWSFSFGISPSNEHSGLISFRMNWLESPKDSQESSPAPQSKSISSSVLSLFYGPILIG